MTSPLHGGEWLASRSNRFIPRKEPRCLSNGRQGGPHSRYRPFGEEKNHLSLPGFMPSTVKRRKEALKLRITKQLNSAGLLCIILGEVDWGDDQTTDDGTVYRQILINAKQTGKRGQKAEMTRKNPRRRRKFAMDCIAI